jgi:hypothetical protein
MYEGSNKYSNGQLLNCSTGLSTLSAALCVHHEASPTLKKSPDIVDSSSSPLPNDYKLKTLHFVDNFSIPREMSFPRSWITLSGNSLGFVAADVNASESRVAGG